MSEFRSQITSRNSVRDFVDSFCLPGRSEDRTRLTTKLDVAKIPITSLPFLLVFFFVIEIGRR